jgi:hypothetical protein
MPRYGYYLVDLDAGTGGRKQVRSIEQAGAGRCTAIFALSWRTPVRLERRD